MLRRFSASRITPIVTPCTHQFAFRYNNNSSTAELGRQDATKTLSKISEEFKGQSLDLKDMCNAARVALKEATDLQARLAKMEADENLKNKVQGLVGSLKAYSVRLGTVQGESQSLQADIDSILKGQWKKDSAGTGAATATKKPEPVEPEIVVEPPSSKPTPPKPTQPESTAEIIEETEILVETVESQTSNKGTSFESEASKLSVTEITEFLHDKDVNFADCFDAASLRKRYVEVKSGKYEDASKRKKLHDLERKREEEIRANATKAKQNSGTGPVRDFNQGGGSSNTTNNNNSSNSYGGSQSTGLVQDPFPGAERKMVDPMKYVWEVKEEICKSKGMNPSLVDLWCGYTLLEDHRRVYDYPMVANNALEFRNKGDIKTPPGQQQLRK
eukprot:PhF_6_TR33467/c0_g1_i1/m.48815